MKKSTLLFLAAVLPTTSPAAILAGFYAFNTTADPESADIAASGITSSVVKNTTSNTAGGGGSNDNFYGNSPLPVLGTATDDGVIRLIAGNLTLTTSYSGAGSYALTSILFDAGTTTGAGNLTVSYSINGGSSVPLTPTALTMGAVTGGYTDFPDYGLSFAPGTNLNSGDSIVITFNMAAGGTARLDNIALTGDLIPEPGSILLAACGLIPLLRRRR